MRIVVITLLAVLLVATNGIDEISTATQSSYVIKSRQVNDVTEALTLLRRFIPGEPSSLQRCEKYAVLLHMLTSSVVDQFAIAELGLASKDTVRAKHKLIDVETLRQLYIDGINSVLASFNLDPAVLELVDCLTQKFLNIDAKVRSFLNKLPKTIEQYKSIVKMPLTFVLDPNVVHPELESDKLEPTIRQTLDKIFINRISPFYTKFPLEHQKSASSSSSLDYSKDFHHDIQTVPSSVDSNPDLVAQNEVQKSGPVQVEDATVTLTEEEHEYINKLLAAIIRVQQALVAETQLNDRCKAYAKVIHTNQETLNDKLIGEAISEVPKQSDEKKSDEPFVPEKTIRDYFVFVVSTFGPPELGDEAWVDLVYCTSQWQQVDPEVREFISSPKLIREIEEIMSNAEKAALEAEKNERNKDMASDVDGVSTSSNQLAKP